MTNNSITRLSIITYIVIIFSISAIYAQAQNIKQSNFRQIVIEISVDSLEYKLPDNRIVAFSEIVYSNNNQLKRGLDFSLDYSNGTIKLIESERLSSQITVTYYAIPDFLTQKFYQYEMQDVKDSLFTGIGLNKRRIVYMEDSRLLVTGSKTFSLTFSNQQSYDLKQSLFLQLDGELSSNMKIEGRLSDSQSPLTPEGDSREISSLDQVYLKLYRKQYSVTFGDQEHEFTNTALMKYKTRFEGINLSYHDRFAVQGAIAVNGGKTAVNIISGVEGKQGPYYLTANTGGLTVLVVAGSERVSVNGETFNRGEDYTIDYSEGSLFFKKLITSNSRIIVNFQYSDDYYRQNTYLTSASVNITPNLSLNQHMINQTDSKDNPLQYTFSEADKDSLRQAGDNIVWGQGIFEVEPGTGQYISKIDPENNIYYEYAENDTTASYLVFFSFVGAGLGDYDPFASNKYMYKGKGLGSWLPVKKLIAPADYTNLGLNLQYQKNSWVFQTEGVLTNQDRNTFSDKDDSDNQSFIAKALVEYIPPELRLNPQAKLSYLHKSENNFSFSNLTPDHELYEFNSLPSLDSEAQQQLDFSFGLRNAEFWSQNLSLRYKNVMNTYTQKYVKSETRINQSGLYPSLNWYGIYSYQEFQDSTLESSKLNYQDLDSGWKWKILHLKTRYLLQRENINYAMADTIATLTGRQFTRFNPSIILSNETTYSSSISFSAENNQRKLNSDWQNLSSFHTWQFYQLINKQFNTLNMNLTHRDSEYQNTGNDSSGAQNQKYDLFDVKSSHQLWDNSLSLNSAYQVNRLEFFPKIKELQYVGNGLGSYDVDSVYVVNGDYDYVYTTSGSGQLATEINANLSIFYHLSQKYLPKSFWHRFHLDSNLQITNNTTEQGTPELYLLLLDDFFASDSTKFGRKFMQHNLWLDLWQNVLTGNLRYEVSNTLDNRYQEFSKTYNENREIELDWKQISGYKLQTSYLNGIERNSRYSSEVKNSEVTAVIFRNLSTRANLQLTSAYILEKGNSTSQSQPYKMSSFRIQPSSTLYLTNKYRLTSSFSAQFNKRSGSDLLSFLPDKRNGSIFNWSVQTQYRLNSFTSGVFEYSGKSYPQEDVLHELKMEFRAEL